MDIEFVNQFSEGFRISRQISERPRALYAASNSERSEQDLPVGRFGHSAAKVLRCGDFRKVNGPTQAVNDQ
jgi:hypothetical protein